MHSNLINFRKVGEEKVVGRCKIANYFLSPKLKFPLKGRHFQTVEEIQCAVTRDLNISKTAFLEGMNNLKEGTCKQLY
jgi:hypothetical protein